MGASSFVTNTTPHQTAAHLQQYRQSTDSELFAPSSLNHTRNDYDLQAFCKKKSQVFFTCDENRWARGIRGQGGRGDKGELIPNS